MSNKEETPKDVLSAPEDNAQPLNYREQFQGRQAPSQYIDPCAAAAKASLDCMSQNEFKKEKCTDYFQAYRDCKKTWIEQRKADRRAGRPTT